jgi:hypothetical protein
MLNLCELNGPNLPVKLAIRQKQHLTYLCPLFLEVKRRWVKEVFGGIGGRSSEVQCSLKGSRLNRYLVPICSF